MLQDPDFSVENLGTEDEPYFTTDTFDEDEDTEDDEDIEDDDDQPSDDDE